uniref:DUF725 domain-containing protein n=1 Tax=Panagrellus redivivus TaxID=6233 RepID=A0A7E4ULI1_PANRE
MDGWWEEDIVVIPRLIRKIRSSKMQAFVVFCGLLVAGAMGQLPTDCQRNCVTTNTPNAGSYRQLFSGSISESDYNAVCNAISNIRTCLSQCSGQQTTQQNQNVLIGSTDAPVDPADYQVTDTVSSNGPITSTPTLTLSGVADCLTTSLPLYTSACSAGYQQFSTLGDCFNKLNSGFAAANQTCQEQCATASNTNNRRRRRRQTLTSGIISVQTFCVTNCGLSQQLPAIQQQCSPWVAQFAQTVSTVYNNLYQVLQSCLSV